MSSNKTKAKGISAWENRISKHLKLRKKLRVLSFEEVSERLKLMGINQSRENLSNKFQTGKMSSALFFSILNAMEEDSIDLQDFNK